MHELQLKFDKLYELSANMRHYQILSETYRCSSDRDKYNYYKRELDKFIKKEHAERKSGQIKLV